MSQFRLGDFLVDTDRCQVQYKNDNTYVEPKVMDVLAYLAKHQGKVVSQQELFSVVWPDVVYSPSSIQRCITILRKAFREDAKNPKIIITHPKRGYSLEFPINEPSNRNKANSFKYNGHLFSVLAIMGLVTIVYLFFSINKDIIEKGQYSKLVPIISTGKDELHPRFSPDGRHIAFITLASDDKYHIWVKSLESGKVRQLSARPSNYISVSWYQDQQAIGFVERTNKGDRIGRLPFNRYQAETVAAQILISLKEERISSQLQLTKNGELIFVAKDKRQRTHIFRYAANMQVREILLGEKQASDIYNIALSHDDKTLALAGVGKHNLYPIHLLDIKTKQLLPLAMITGGIHGLDWHPSNSSLLVSNRNKLRMVELSGAITDVKFTNALYIANANYNSDGEKITMTLIGMDVDIISSSTQNLNETRFVINSNAVDMQPLFSPDSNTFTFISTRSGNQQVFIYQNGVERLLVKNSDDKEFFGMAWSPNGQNIAVALEDTINIIDVKSGEIVRNIKHELPSIYIRDWYHHENALLVNLPGPIAAKYDLDKLTTTQLSGHPSYGSALDSDDSIYFNLKTKVIKLENTGAESIFWQPKKGTISHLYTNKEGLFFELDSDNSYRFLKMDFDKNISKEYPTSKVDVNWLADVSPDGEKLLYMSRTERTRTVFTLE